MTGGNFYDYVGREVKKARLANNLTIMELSKLTGEWDKTIRNIESGKAFSFHNASWIFNLLKIDLNLLIKNYNGNVNEVTEETNGKEICKGGEVFDFI